MTQKPEPKDAIGRLLEIMRLLRDKDQGCPWDLKQTFRSIAPHTIEEAYEVLECIENEDLEHLPNELGDLLFQVVFYARMGEEAGLFDFADVVAEISDKLLTRHPHVFPDATIESFGRQSSLSPADVEARWEVIKQAERREKGGADAPGSVFDDVPSALPAMLRARKLQKRAANVGFDWPHAKAVMGKVREELEELEEAIDRQDQGQLEEELGDLLFTLVNLSRHLDSDAERSLRLSNSKFEARFRLMEKKVRDKGLEMEAMELAELDRLWESIKAEREQTG